MRVAWLLGKVALGDGGGGDACYIVVELCGRGVLWLVSLFAFLVWVVVPVSCLAFAGGFGGLFVL